VTETHPGPLASPPGHPDPDTLADFDAGVLDPARTDKLRAHVSTCTHCGSILAGINDVPVLLRRLSPPRLPAEVEARIFAALDAERLARFGPLPAAPGSGAVVSLAAARESRRRRTRLIGLVAAGLVLVAGGAATAVGLTNRSTQTADNTALAEHGNKGAGGAPAAPPADASDLPAYDSQTITRSPLLIRILNGERGPLTQSGDGSLSQQRLQSCASGIARVLPGVGGRPAGVQHISFEGRRAYLLVYTGGAGRMLVVVAESCSGEEPNVLYSRAV
jgi:hypothetical protein